MTQFVIARFFVFETNLKKASLCMLICIRLTKSQP